MLKKFQISVLELQIHLCFLTSIPIFFLNSQEELQQCSSFLWQCNTKRGGWSGADCYQGVSEVSDHIPADPAPGEGSRLQARTSEWVPMPGRAPSSQVLLQDLQLGCPIRAPHKYMAFTSVSLSS